MLTTSAGVPGVWQWGTSQHALTSWRFSLPVQPWWFEIYWPEQEIPNPTCLQLCRMRQKWNVVCLFFPFVTYLRLLVIFGLLKSSWIRIVASLERGTVLFSGTFLFLFWWGFKASKTPTIARTYSLCSGCPRFAFVPHPLLRSGKLTS